MPVLLVVGIAMLIAFYQLLKSPTAAGRPILDRILGFRLYLSVGEQERLNLEDPPQRTPALFETFLPYALALDVEQQWSQQFAGVLSAAAQEVTVPSGETGYTPSWYSGTAWSTLGAAGFADALGSSMSSAISSSSTAPGSSSGSGSGGGGGGSSGGGGGGGGGGGW